MTSLAQRCLKCANAVVVLDQATCYSQVSGVDVATNSPVTRIADTDAVVRCASLPGEFEGHQSSQRARRSLHPKASSLPTSHTPAHA